MLLQATLRSPRTSAYTAQALRSFSTTRLVLSVNKRATAEEAVKAIKSGDTILSGGFGLCGIPDTLLKALSERGAGEVNNLTIASNNAGVEEKGLGQLVKADQVKKLIVSHIGATKLIENKYLAGDIEVELTPQGTIAERIRAAGAGIPAFFTPTGASTAIETGGVPYLNAKDGQEAKFPDPRPTMEFDGRKYVMERALKGDVALIHAWKADEAGNLVFRYTATNFNGPMCKGAKHTIVEAEEIVPTGTFDPCEIHVPGVYVDKIVQADRPKQIETLILADDGKDADASLGSGAARKGREMIVKRAAQELKDGYYVNLGIGMPTLLTAHLPKDQKVWLQSENGLLGIGPPPTKEQVDPDVINAGKETITMANGAAVFDSAESFAMIRGGHIDVAVLGAMEVSAAGDLANWIIPGALVKGMGGAMDLVSSPDQTKIIITTDHVNKRGEPKIVQECSLPLTGARCVSMIVTELAVFEVDRKAGKLTLTELMPGATLEEVVAKTGAKFDVSPNLKTAQID
ncbi:coenzyme A transferase, putative [Trichosporon asahii var. asahii CBS 2479]|uniref:Succinyl-CoA:3-ketoacid-coenzyme A transferase n=1 Tax=Trichosporon asahii var. asahii (strain ATCC 90039 / CBS 2479 / JCM 2466 / KCTC 7840 / NBRC 103889/ NCYC 2677 / UAMH 7654) TaxID=1186058 RepID=J6ESF3_TRIAS|nr:coenzyme A transferase, putative [Trichosporon asahii var. asahii CBS 2479]EJT47459.1 coenzyme A transferase, putative [Trichosporon asahii var. asahii CBS 2479]